MSDWPRLYLLNLYRDAVERGHIVVEGLTQERATSLKMALYRLRRRSDAANKTIILPEYFLVTCGEWKPNRDYHKSQPEWQEEELGDMPIIYSSLPEADLPRVRDASTGEYLPTVTDRLGTSIPQVTVLPPSDHMPLPPAFAEVHMDEDDISNYVAKMRKAASESDSNA